MLVTVFKKLLPYELETTKSTVECPPAQIRSEDVDGGHEQHILDFIRYRLAKNIQVMKLNKNSSHTHIF
jgi:hypothetical protein